MKARPSIQEYMDASIELSNLQQRLYDAKYTDKPHALKRLLLVPLLFSGDNYDATKYRTDPAYKAQFTPEQISYLDNILSIDDEIDLLSAKCVSLWCEYVTKLNPDCYVFSIGSGRAQLKQQIPEFVRQRNDGFTAILNIDEFKPEPDETSRYFNSYLGAHLNANTKYNANTKFMEEFIEQVGKLLALGKKVIIMDFCAPPHVKHYRGLLKKHKAYIDESLSFFLGYFVTCPVFQIHAGAITDDIDRNLQNVIAGFKGGGPNPELNDPPPEFTSRYVHIDDITYAHLFRPEVATSSPTANPSETAETLFSRPGQADKKILDNFFENRETFDETPDGKESWEMTNQELIDSVVAMIPEKHRANIDLFTIKRRDIEKCIQEAVRTESLKKS